MEGAAADPQAIRDLVSRMKAVACENMENESEVNRNVEMMLLVKTNGHWKIAAQAWDRETNTLPIPDELLTRVLDPQPSQDAT